MRWWGVEVGGGHVEQNAFTDVGHFRGALFFLPHRSREAISKLIK